MAADVVGLMSINGQQRELEDLGGVQCLTELKVPQFEEALGIEAAWGRFRD